jgi:hypothetical protein
VDLEPHLFLDDQQNLLVLVYLERLEVLECLVYQKNLWGLQHLKHLEDLERPLALVDL